MAFSFGFSGDDIEPTAEEEVFDTGASGSAAATIMDAPTAPAQTHRVEDLVGKKWIFYISRTFRESLIWDRVSLPVLAMFCLS